MSNEWWKNISSRIHMEMVSGRVERGDTQQALAFIERNIPLAKSWKILDVACGHGRHTSELRKQGYNTYGLDYTEGLLSVAQEQTPENIWIRGNMLELPVKPESIDLVLLMWQILGYFNSEKENQEVLNQVANSLKPGGYMVTELVNSLWEATDMASKGATAKDGKTHFTQEDDDYIHQSSFDPLAFRTSGVTTSKKDPSSKMEIDMRLYTYPEIRTMLQNCGIQIVGAFGSFEDDPLSIQSKYSIIIGQKTN